MQLWSKKHKNRLKKAGFSEQDIRLAETLSTHHVLLGYNTQSLYTVMEALCQEQGIASERWSAVAGDFFPNRCKIRDETFFQAYQQQQGDLFKLIRQLITLAQKPRKARPKPPPSLQDISLPQSFDRNDCFSENLPSCDPLN